MKYENVRLTEAVRRIRMIFVVGVIAACVERIHQIEL